jgi:hypothetical protein
VWWPRGDRAKPDPDHQSSQGLHACAASTVEMTFMSVELRKLSRIELIVIDLYRFRNYAESLMA